MIGDGKGRPDQPRPTHHRPLPAQGAWTARAACRGRDPALWFVDRQDGNYAAARAICAACPVQPDCLDWALRAGEEQGFWGGKTPIERRRLRRRAS